MRLTSPAFQAGSRIPQKYGRDFQNINPPLTINDVPAGTISLALIMEDPDVPSAAGVPIWDHWVVFDIPAEIKEIPEHWSPVGIRGQGTRGELEYGGPRPPDREHRYFFKIFALDSTLALPEGATKQEVLAAMKGHVLGEAELMGRFAPTK
jgi:Raf kinase inhibitor-like YbhB/YbcL family protein